MSGGHKIFCYSEILINFNSTNTQANSTSNEPGSEYPPSQRISALNGIRPYAMILPKKHPAHSFVFSLRQGLYLLPFTFYPTCAQYAQDRASTLSDCVRITIGCWLAAAIFICEFSSSIYRISVYYAARCIRLYAYWCIDAWKCIWWLILDFLHSTTKWRRRYVPVRVRDKVRLSRSPVAFSA